MKIDKFLQRLVVCSVVLASTPGIAQNMSASPSVQRWVHGSWVNARSAPSANSSVLTRLVVNTPVQLLDAPNTGGYCEVTWGQAQRGFLACNLLGDHPLTIEEVDSPTRAFWIEPSFWRLKEAGDFFGRTMLPPQQLALENEVTESNLPALRRFPIPEFEAMKELMKNGVIEPRPDPSWGGFFGGPVLWSELKQAANIGGREAVMKLSWGESAHFPIGIISVLKQLELPSVSTSHFKTVAVIGRPSFLAQHLSYQFKIPYAIKILSGAKWGGDVSGPVRFGAWDMGETEVFLTERVHKISISNRGAIGIQLTPVSQTYKPGDSCAEGFQFGSATATPGALPAFTSPQSGADFPLFFFYTKMPLVKRNAKVFLEAKRKFNTEETEGFGIGEVFTHGTTKFFDIDWDGIFDLAVWEGWRASVFADESSNAKPVPNFRMFFVNAGGQWYLLDIDDYLYECKGC